MSQEIVLRLCQGRLQCLLFLLFCFFCVVCYSCHWQKQEEGELGKAASQTGKRERMIPSLLAGEQCFKYFPQQLVGAAGAPLALLKWEKLHIDSCCTLLMEVQRNVNNLNYTDEFTPDEVWHRFPWWFKHYPSRGRESPWSGRKSDVSSQRGHGWRWVVFGLSSPHQELPEPRAFFTKLCHLHGTA